MAVVALGEQDAPAKSSPLLGPLQTPCVEPKVPGLDGTDADLRDFIDSKVSGILQQLEGHERLLESISYRLEKVGHSWRAGTQGRWSGRRPSQGMPSQSASGLMPISSGVSSQAFGDLIPISPRNSNPSVFDGDHHFATRLRQTKEDFNLKKDSVKEDFASYSQTDAVMFETAKDHGLRQMEAAERDHKIPEVGRF